MDGRCMDRRVRLKVVWDGMGWDGMVWYGMMVDTEESKKKDGWMGGVWIGG